MHIFAILTGFAAGFVAWCVGSYSVSLFIYWGATRPQPMTDKTLKAYEVTLCGLVFALSLAVFFVTVRALWPDV